jgi:hypothetical protein
MGVMSLASIPEDEAALSPLFLRGLLTQKVPVPAPSEDLSSLALSAAVHSDSTPLSGPLARHRCAAAALPPQRTLKLRLFMQQARALVCRPTHGGSVQKGLSMHLSPCSDDLDGPALISDRILHQQPSRIAVAAPTNTRPTGGKAAL